MSWRPSSGMFLDGIGWKMCRSREWMANHTAPRVDDDAVSRSVRDLGYC